MIAMNHRLVHMCVNRCKRPADGDILLPLRTACVIGTTDVFVPDPDETEIRQADIDLLLDEGEKLVPGFRQARALHAWAGVRPLFEDTAVVAETRDVTRSHALLDHSAREGVAGFLTITGGKTTTFRLMAEVGRRRSVSSNSAGRGRAPRPRCRLPGSEQPRDVPASAAGSPRANPSRRPRRSSASAS